MSWFDLRATRGLGAAVLLGMVVLSSGCTVRPLYSDASSTTSAIAPDVAGLRAISIPPVGTRVAQQVRNELIFMLNGGQGQPPEPLYNLVLSVTAANAEAGLVSVDNENRNTAGTVTVAASYVLTEINTGQSVATGHREIFSSYDRSNQEFAVMRARRDAEDRGARELAELLRLEIGQKLSRHAAGTGS